MENDKIILLQNYLKKTQIDAFIFFLCDDHGSEYINDSFKIIPYLTNFTGSNATLLVLQNEILLWTDGRYFLQAKRQLANNIILMKIGIDQNIEEYIKDNINSLFFDFKTAKTNIILHFKKLKPKLILKDASLFIKTFWSNNIVPNKKIFLLPNNIYLQNAHEKCHKTLNHIKNNGNYAILVSALDDIAYLLNARGHDIKYNPVFMAFLFLTKVDNIEHYILYIKKNKLTDDIKKSLQDLNIIIKPYFQIYRDVAKFKDIIYFDSDKTNFKLYSLMTKKKSVILYPTLTKCIKNNLDIKETKKIHLYDAIAMCKFIYYIKHNLNKKQLTELSVAKKLEHLRKKQGAFELSFATIVGYKENGAIVHYSATKETNLKINNESFLLVDSGGQYFYGTTDITRTLALGKITKEMKFYFTLVLKAHIDLAMATFDNKTTDASLDLIARKPLWEHNLDYNHGTGHGIGHMLNVHEGPQSIRYNKQKPTIMKKGMITSDEPGLYFENLYGIRHENELLCVKINKNQLGFEPLTYVPFDISAIDKTILNENEINYLNNYHQMVYKKVSKYLTKKERKYLKDITKEI